MKLSFIEVILHLLYVCLTECRSRESGMLANVTCVGTAWNNPRWTSCISIQEHYIPAVCASVFQNVQPITQMKVFITVLSESQHL